MKYFYKSRLTHRCLEAARGGQLAKAQAAQYDEY